MTAGRGARAACPHAVSGPALERLGDSVHRALLAERPNQIWVADFTYVAFVIDVQLPDFRGESGDLLTHSHTSTPLTGRLKLLGADAAKVAVPTGAIVESIDVVGDVR